MSLCHGCGLLCKCAMLHWYADTSPACLWPVCHGLRMCVPGAFAVAAQGYKVTSKKGLQSN
eukprot:1158243-Pelagomonas_calceolata.AAC.5